MEQKEVIYPELVEANTREEALQWRKMLFYNEWPHPGEWEADAQKPKLLDGLEVTDSIEQNHKAPWVGGSGMHSKLIAQWGGKNNKTSLQVWRTALRSVSSVSVRSHGKVGRVVVPA